MIAMFVWTIKDLVTVLFLCGVGIWWFMMWLDSRQDKGKKP